MIPTTTKDIAQFLNATIKAADTAKADRICENVSIDSRTLRARDLFITIKGDNFDGHDFIEDAFAKGASAVICERPIKHPGVQVVVDDAKKALTALAELQRKEFTGPVIALTGSYGKTTVKTMIASIVESVGNAWLVTEGNYNNDIGLPLTLLRFNPKHSGMVLELGANHIGDIDVTASIAKPTVALITTIGACHLEGFGDLEGVATGKGEIYRHLCDEGTAIVNQDLPYREIWEKEINGKKTLTFGMTDNADVWLSDEKPLDDRCWEATLHYGDETVSLRARLPGKHQLINMLAAASAAIAVDIPLAQIAEGILRSPIVPGRLIYRDGVNGSRIIDDTYNASFESVLAGLEELSAHNGKKLFVFGGMGECGSHHDDLHKQVGDAVKKLKIDHTFIVGDLAKATLDTIGEEATQCNNTDEAVTALLGALTPGTLVYIKGSRSTRLERVVRPLLSKT